MNMWYRPVDSTGNNIGINDSSYHTFRVTKYESLAREIAQNSLDERYEKNKPVRIEFNLFEIKKEKLPDLQNYEVLFKDGLNYWKNDNQDNAKIFFQNALDILSMKQIKVMRISDFNTNGVLGAKSDKIYSDSARDIRPWQNLLKSEGSSSKGGTQGGSFGIGKNATFATSSLRTVIYSTYDKEGVKAHEGVAKLATVVKNKVAYSAKSYYGNIVDSTSIAIDGLINLDPKFTRTSYGTDIYVLGFEDDENWRIRIIKSILSDFMIPIKNGDLQVNFINETIDSNNIGKIFDKYINYCEKNQLRQYLKEMKSSKNYYDVLVSKEAMEFETNFGSMGKAKLRVLYDTNYERRVLRTRETGMKLFEKGNISSTIGFCGIVKIQGEQLSKLFREMENPAHDKWSIDNIIDEKRKKLGERTEKQLNSWIKRTILENAMDKTQDEMDVVGLSDYLPMQAKPSDKKEKESADKISTKINQITVKKIDREKFKSGAFIEKIVENYGKVDDNALDDVFYKPKDKDKKTKGKKIKVLDYSEEGDVLIFEKLRSRDYKIRLTKQKEKYNLKLKFEKKYQQLQIRLFISGESQNTKALIKSAENTLTLEKYKYYANKIFVDLKNESRDLNLSFQLKENIDYSMEVEIYEIEQQ